MIRKQLYIRRRQDQILKRLARERGVSEAEVVRQALDREAQLETEQVRNSGEALSRLIATARALEKKPGASYQFDRDEVYQDRESRRNSDR